MNPNPVHVWETLCVRCPWMMKVMISLVADQLLTLCPNGKPPALDLGSPSYKSEYMSPKEKRLLWPCYLNLQNLKVSQCGTPFYTFLYRPPLGIRLSEVALKMARLDLDKQSIEKKFPYLCEGACRNHVWAAPGHHSLSAFLGL